MAFSSSLIKKKYENLSIEELEEKYEALKKNYCFNSKEEEIAYIIKNYLKVSMDTNNNSTKIALEELLTEKTGKEYKMESKRFDITLTDVIKFIATHTKETFLDTTLINFFQKLDNVTDQEKKNFLIQLIQDKNSFDEFIKEISQTEDSKETYNKYKTIAKEYMQKHKIIS